MQSRYNGMWYLVHGVSASIALDIEEMKQNKAGTVCQLLRTRLIDSFREMRGLADQAIKSLGGKP
jgi:hypothetical protein